MRRSHCCLWLHGIRGGSGQLVEQEKLSARLRMKDMILIPCRITHIGGRSTFSPAHRVSRALIIDELESRPLIVRNSRLLVNGAKSGILYLNGREENV